MLSLGASIIEKYPTEIQFKVNSVTCKECPRFEGNLNFTIQNKGDSFKKEFKLKKIK